MPFERRAEGRVWIDRHAVEASASPEFLRETVRALLGWGATETSHPLEFNLGGSRCLRFDLGGRRRSRSILVSTSCPVVSLVERVDGATGCAVVAWFSLERGWMFDARPEATAEELVIYDRRHRLTWTVRVESSCSTARRRRIKSTLPVEDVAGAVAAVVDSHRATRFGPWRGSTDE